MRTENGSHFLPMNHFRFGRNLIGIFNGEIDITDREKIVKCNKKENNLCESGIYIM